MIKLKKILLEVLSEGVYDPGILKVVFLAGGPGSGKTTVSTQVLGIKFNSFAVSGLKPVNSDKFFEHLLKVNNLPTDLSKLTQAEFDKITSGPGSIRSRAKSLMQSQLTQYLAGRLGLIIDGTGDDVDKITKQREQLENLYGYDTSIIFVNTTLEKALDRNNNRDRVLPKSIVVGSWNAAQKARDAYKQLFGANFYEIYNNVDSKPGEPVAIDDQVEKKVDAFLRKPIQNPVGKEWMSAELRSKNKSVNEATSDYKIYCDMDGVLCDFEKQWMVYFNKDANEHRREIGKPAYDVLLDGTPFDFWAKMPWQSGGQKLWNTIKMHNPSILSAPADSKASEDGKRAWVAKNLNPRPEVIFRKSNRKQEFATPTSILIDDHESNIERWSAAGGIAIHHTDINKTLSELSKYISL